MLLPGWERSGTVWPDQLLGWKWLKKEEWEWLHPSVRKFPFELLDDYLEPDCENVIVCHPKLTLDECHLAASGESVAGPGHTGLENGGLLSPWAQAVPFPERIDANTGQSFGEICKDLGWEPLNPDTMVRLPPPVNPAAARQKNRKDSMVGLGSPISRRMSLSNSRYSSVQRQSLSA